MFDDIKIELITVSGYIEFDINLSEETLSIIL